MKDSKKEYKIFRMEEETPDLILNVAKMKRWSQAAVINEAIQKYCNWYLAKHAAKQQKEG